MAVAETAPGGAKAFVFTFRVAGSNTSITCTIAAAAILCSSAATATVLTGDVISVQVSCSGTQCVPPSQILHWRAKITSP